MNQAYTIAVSPTQPPNSVAALKAYTDVGIPVLVTLGVMTLGFTLARHWIRNQLNVRSDVMALLVESFKDKTNNQTEAIQQLTLSLQTLTNNDQVELQLLSAMLKSIDSSEASLRFLSTTLQHNSQQIQSILDKVIALHRRLDEKEIK